MRGSQCIHFCKARAGTCCCIVRRWFAFPGWIPNCSTFRKRQSVLVRRPSGEAHLRFHPTFFEWHNTTGASPCQGGRWCHAAIGQRSAWVSWGHWECWEVRWSVSLPKWHSLLAARQGRFQNGDVLCTGAFAYFCQTGLADFGDGQDSHLTLDAVCDAKQPMMAGDLSQSLNSNNGWRTTHELRPPCRSGLLSQVTHGVWNSKKLHYAKKDRESALAKVADKIERCGWKASFM